MKIDAGHCKPLSVLDDYLYETLCPRPNSSAHGYRRQDQGKTRTMRGVSCSLSTMNGRETPDSPIPTLGECHTHVPAGGLTLRVPAGGAAARLALISARYSNMDGGRRGDAAGADPVALARRAWSDANASTTGGELFAEHVRAMGRLLAPGIEVAGNLQLAQLVNASVGVLLGAYEPRVLLKTKGGRGCLVL